MTAQTPAEQSQWAQIIARDPGHSQRYIDRFKMLADQGADLVGEARLIDAMVGRGSTILDAGCGPGRHSGYLHRAGHRVVGVDLDPALIGWLVWRLGEAVTFRIRMKGEGERSR